MGYGYLWLHVWSNSQQAKYMVLSMTETVCVCVYVWKFLNNEIF